MEYGKKTGNVFENGPFISTSRISKIVKACSNGCYDVLPYTVKKNIFMSWKVFPLDLLVAFKGKVFALLTLESFRWFEISSATANLWCLFTTRSLLITSVTAWFDSYRPGVVLC